MMVLRACVLLSGVIDLGVGFELDEEDDFCLLRALGAVALTMTESL
jgi:hypothetical protein